MKVRTEIIPWLREEWGITYHTAYWGLKHYENNVNKVEAWLTPPGEDELTVKELASMRGCTVQRVNQLIDSRHIPFRLAHAEGETGRKLKLVNKNDWERLGIKYPVGRRKKD